MGKLDVEILDKILPIHGKCLYLQYANNLNINTMKAFEILEMVFKEDLDNSQCGVVRGSSVCDGQWKSYFGFNYTTMEPIEERDYFYMYSKLNTPYSPWPVAKICLWNAVGEECVSLWEIEN